MHTEILLEKTYLFVMTDGWHHLCSMLLRFIKRTQKIVIIYFCGIKILMYFYIPSVCSSNCPCNFLLLGVFFVLSLHLFTRETNSLFSKSLTPILLLDWSGTRLLFLVLGIATLYSLRFVNCKIRPVRSAIHLPLSQNEEPGTRKRRTTDF